jgi:hypothetical protein
MRGFRGTEPKQVGPFFDRLTPVLPEGEPIYYMDDAVRTFGNGFYDWMKQRTIIVINDRGAVTKRDIEQYVKQLGG